MSTYSFRYKIILILILLVLSACDTQGNSLQTQETELAVDETATVSMLAATPTVQTEQTLTICMAGEPRSLFLYGDNSLAARNIRQAIFDGPVEYHGYDAEAPILEKVPDLQNGAVSFAPVAAEANALIADLTGATKNLSEGVSYFPAGCRDASCAQVYSGTEAASLDQMVVRFTLKDGLTWSDGTALTAGDLLFSYEVARKLNLPAMADLLQRTHSYQVLDDKTVEWRGIPGLVDSSYLRYFFSPLPRHAWGSLETSALMTDPLSSQAPLGWGAYVRPGMAAWRSNYFDCQPAVFPPGRRLAGI